MDWYPIPKNLVNRPAARRIPNIRNSVFFGERMDSMILPPRYHDADAEAFFLSDILSKIFAVIYANTTSRASPRNGPTHSHKM